MLASLVPQYSIIHIAGKKYRIRYTLNTLLYLEQCYKPIYQLIENLDAWNINDTLHLAAAAMCSLPWNKKAVIQQDWENIKPNIFELGETIESRDLRTLNAEIMHAISQSFPPPIVGKKTSGQKDIDGLRLRAVYVDSMGRPLKELLDSTLGEVTQRIEAYNEANGYKEPMVHVQEFDDEGIDG